MSHTNNALIVFSRNPILGKVKTRISKTCGDTKTLDIYKNLLLNNSNLIDKLIDIKTFIYYDQYTENQIYKDKHTKEIQVSGSLGEKMLNAFLKCKKKGFKNIIIIGSDCPYITPSIIDQAFKKLKNYSFVIGPSRDGGYYLLGMKEVRKELFENKKWSSDKVFKSTIKDIEIAKKTYCLLEELNDIDYFEDWVEYENQLNI
tara:strand:+ start:1436 stop:2041 length:606 start_codon:yes stop_codon:yes gene_type:complete